MAFTSNAYMAFRAILVAVENFNKDSHGIKEPVLEHRRRRSCWVRQIQSVIHRGNMTEVS